MYQLRFLIKFKPYMSSLNFKYTFIILLSIIAFLFSGCDKENNENEIPLAYVNFFINPNSTFYWRLNSPGGWEYVVADEPSRGIIIYRGLQDEFKAYERTCPYDPHEPCARVEVEPGDITLIDKCCNSRFLILDGSPVDGPSKRPLRQYRTTYDGNVLHVFN